MLATFLLSRVGVAGTIAGAACTPVIISLTNATLSPQIRHARERAASLVAKPRESWWCEVMDRLPRGRRLAGTLATAGAAFLIVAALITIAEALVGKPVSDWGHNGGSGYTFTGGGSPSTSPVSTNRGLTQTQTSSQPPQASSQPPQTSSHPAQSQTTRTTQAPRPTSSTTSTAQPTTTPPSGSTTNPAGGAPLP
ncbi:MAG TPA: hypothetical protein VG325_18265 [Solirubrobacteraceae bacterium]|nr:hypothetical protein [Solirubrobacteraceae bacterium]